MRPTTGPLLLGVDTGGTYTDAVLLEAHDRAVVASAKALTTRQDLAVGVSNALARISAELDGSRIVLVSISTTLATNAVVEGQGSPVLALLVGFDDNMVERSGISSAFRDVIVERLAGGHDHHGTERAPLDLAHARTLLDDIVGRVSAVAIASSFAVRNTAHEEALRNLVVEQTELPVTISSALSDSLDAPRRALTTVLNARLLSRITDLIDAVNRSLAELSIDAPVMIAKGDGSLASVDAVARRPIETVLSGPAASVVGAAALSGLDDFILSDIGGTTTDVGQLIAGRPRLAPDGAKVGGWRTMVNAIDVRTSGLGGDSEVHTDVRSLSVGPRRTVPISLLGQQHPEIVDELVADLADPPARDLAAGYVIRLDEPVHDNALSASERRVFERLGAQPIRLCDAAQSTIERRSVLALADRGIVQIAGFTPSDAAHVLGHQDNWSFVAAQVGAELIAWYTGDPIEEFCHRVWSEVVRRSAGCVLEVAFDDLLGDPLSSEVVDAVASGRGSVARVGVRVVPQDPIVAVGGPAGVYYTEVAKRLGAQLVLPTGFAVANAVGAAAGQLVARAVAEVHTDGPGLFRVVCGGHIETANSGSNALLLAEERAYESAGSSLDELADGLPEIGRVERHVEIERHDDPDALGDEGLYTAVVRAELRARPVSGRVRDRG